MIPREHQAAPRISGVSVSGEPIWIDYSANLMNVVTFFDPVSKYSLSTIENLRRMSSLYEKLSVGFWYIMEPRLSCMYHSETAGRTIDRLSLFTGTLYDGNDMIALNAGISSVPAVLVVDSNGGLISRYEGEISLFEIERTLQARIALSGYRDELPQLERPERPFLSARSASEMRQLGYANADFVLGNVVVPETDQEFNLPDFYLLNTIYPFGAWYVSRDFIEGKSGSTVYISCGRSESVLMFAGSDDGARVRVHTSIESPHNLAMGKDVKDQSGLWEIRVDECRPYELLTNSGESDVLLSLQVVSGSFRLYTVEFTAGEPFLIGQPAYRSSRY